MESPSAGRRIVFLDYLRVAACFMVIFVHSIEPFYLDADGTYTRYYIFRFECKNHVRLQNLFRAGRENRKFVYLDTDTVSYEFRLLLGSHEISAEFLVLGNSGGYLIQFGTGGSRFGDVFDFAFE